MTSEASKRSLILGAGPFAQLLVDEIRARPESAYEVAGLLADTDIPPRLASQYPVVGRLEDLAQVLARLQPERIIVCLPLSRDFLQEHHLVEAKVCRHIQVEDGKEVYERLTGKLAIEALTPSSMIFSKGFRPSRLQVRASRGMSLLLALFGLLLCAPLYVLIALAIKLDSKGPVLFVQDRVGLHGKPFKLLKFRTMHPARERVSEWAGDNIHRITRVGRVLRKFRLDELPQFFNVLRGHMNLVGPRPHPASNFELFVLVSRNTPECGSQIPYYSLRTVVRPGITGWAQVRYRYANDLNEEIEKLRFDLYYVKHCSLWLDLRILLETVKVVLTGHDLPDSSRLRVPPPRNAVPRRRRAGYTAKRSAQQLP